MSDNSTGINTDSGMGTLAIIFIILLIIGIGGYFGYKKWWIPKQCPKKDADGNLFIDSWKWDKKTGNCIAETCSTGYGTPMNLTNGGDSDTCIVTDSSCPDYCKDTTCSNKKCINCKYGSVSTDGTCTTTHAPDKLNNGDLLPNGESITSDIYKLIMQTDNNLVLYNGDKIPWATATTTQTQPGTPYSKASLYMQPDGNLVMYDDSGTPLWATGTNMDAQKKLYERGTNYAGFDTGSGHLVVYDGKANTIWSSS